MELSIIIILIASIFYWLDAIRAKENAIEYAKAGCKNNLIEFLDDTVLITKVRLRRNTKGQLSIYREYEFEFSSTGESRYKGRVRLLAAQLIDVEMEPYQFNDYDAE
ncbi:MAG: DUF3301 domain-containing protein [Woeseiaceae bacterium]